MAAAPPFPLPLGPGVRLLAVHPAGLVALAKPSGVRAHPNGKGVDAGALLAAPYDEEAEAYRWPGPEGTERRADLLHRLDGPTSGVLLLALRPDVAEAVRAAFAAHAVRKVYHALVFGAARPDERAPRTWTDRLETRRAAGAVRTEAGRGDESRTIARSLRLGRGPVPLALFELQPLTGRTHQLRVQCARRHRPIVGDATYGDFRRNRDFARATGLKRLFLHAAAIEVSWRDVRGREHSFSARDPDPPEFAAVLG